MNAGPWLRRSWLRAGVVGGLGAWACPRRAAFSHPQPVSFAELHHRPEKQRIECALRVKVEDLEHVARVLSGLPLRYGGKGFEAWIVSYLRRVMVLRGPKGQRLPPLNWVGQESEGAFEWLYLTLPTAPRGGGKELSRHLAGYYVSQGYLLGVVSYQVNTVILTRMGTRETLHFQEDSPRFLRLDPM